MSRDPLPAILQALNMDASMFTLPTHPCECTFHTCYTHGGKCLSFAAGLFLNPINHKDVALCLECASAAIRYGRVLDGVLS